MITAAAMIIVMFAIILNYTIEYAHKLTILYSDDQIILCIDCACTILMLCI